MMCDEPTGATTPICRCRVLYLGSAVPHVTKDGLQGIQEPLRDLYPDAGPLQSATARGIDSWLSVWSNGLLLENVDESQRQHTRFFPIDTLHYCAAVRYVVVSTSATTAAAAAASSSVGSAGGAPRGVEKFLPLDSPFARHAGAASQQPPVFACILRRTTGIKVLECHAFICKKEAAANALVRCCFHAYADCTYARQIEENPYASLAPRHRSKSALGLDTTPAGSQSGSSAIRGAHRGVAGSNGGGSGGGAAMSGNANGSDQSWRNSTSDTTPNEDSIMLDDDCDDDADEDTDTDNYKVWRPSEQRSLAPRDVVYSPPGEATAFGTGTLRSMRSTVSRRPRQLTQPAPGPPPPPPLPPLPPASDRIDRLPAHHHYQQHQQAQHPLSSAEQRNMMLMMNMLEQQQQQQRIERLPTQAAAAAAATMMMSGPAPITKKEANTLKKLKAKDNGKKKKKGAKDLQMSNGYSMYAAGHLPLPPSHAMLAGPYAPPPPPHGHSMYSHHQVHHPSHHHPSYLAAMHYPSGPPAAGAMLRRATSTGNVALFSAPFEEPVYMPQHMRPLSPVASYQPAGFPHEQYFLHQAANGGGVPRPSTAHGSRPASRAAFRKSQQALHMLPVAPHAHQLPLAAPAMATAHHAAGPNAVGPNLPAHELHQQPGAAGSINSGPLHAYHGGAHNNVVNGALVGSQSHHQQNGHHHYQQQVQQQQQHIGHGPSQRHHHAHHHSQQHTSSSAESSPFNTGIYRKKGHLNERAFSQSIRAEQQQQQQQQQQLQQQQHGMLSSRSRSNSVAALDFDAEDDAMTTLGEQLQGLDMGASQQPGNHHSTVGVPVINGYGGYGNVGSGVANGFGNGHAMHNGAAPSGGSNGHVYGHALVEADSKTVEKKTQKKKDKKATKEKR